MSRVLKALLAVGAAAAAALIYQSGKKRRLKKTGAIFLTQIIAKLKDGKLEVLMRLPSIATGDKKWSDEYGGSLDGKPFVFIVRAETNEVDGQPGPRFYHVAWGGKFIEARGVPSFGSQDDRLIQIHDYLRACYQRLTERLPS